MYNQRSGWGIVLAVFGLGILGITLFYSNYLANRLKASEQQNQELFIESLRFFAKQMKAGDFDQGIVSNQIHERRVKNIYFAISSGIVHWFLAIF